MLLLEVPAYVVDVRVRQDLIDQIAIGGLACRVIRPQRPINGMWAEGRIDRAH